MTSRARRTPYESEDPIHARGRAVGARSPGNMYGPIASHEIACTGAVAPLCARSLCYHPSASPATLASQTTSQTWPPPKAALPLAAHSVSARKACSRRLTVTRRIRDLGAARSSDSAGHGPATSRDPRTRATGRAAERGEPMRPSAPSHARAHQSPARQRRPTPLRRRDRALGLTQQARTRTHFRRWG
jgi:hypothetical protein